MHKNTIIVRHIEHQIVTYSIFTYITLGSNIGFVLWTGGDNLSYHPGSFEDGHSSNVTVMRDFTRQLEIQWYLLVLFDEQSLQYIGIL